MLKNTAIFILTYYFALSAYFIYTPLYPVFDRTEKFERHHYLTSQFPFVGTYLLKKPQNLDRDKRYPLVVALHGGGKGSLGAYVSAGDDFQNRMKAFVLMPMARGNEIWATTDGLIISTEKTDGLANAVEITRSLIEKHPIDVDRVYITGSSNGAIGTFAAIARDSDIFAAGVAVNGIWDKKDAPLFRDKEIAVYHGSEDAKVGSLDSSRWKELAMIVGQHTVIVNCGSDCLNRAVRNKPHLMILNVHHFGSFIKKVPLNHKLRHCLETQQPVFHFAKNSLPTFSI